MFPIKKNTAQTIYIPGLVSQITGQLQSNPTLAAADCAYSLDGGAFTPFNTTPDVFPAAGTQVRIQLTAGETNGDVLTIRFQDTAGAEWDDFCETFLISTHTVGDVGAKTDNLPSDPADESLIEAAITAIGTAIRGVDADTLKTLSDQVDAVHAKTTNLPADPADESLLEAAIATRPTAVQIDAQLSGVHGAGSWEVNDLLGPGSIAWPVTIVEGGLPVDGVNVWISTDAAGANVIASGMTDDSGVVTFMLDAGNYYCWKQLAGHDASNPEAFTVAP